MPFKHCLIVDDSEVIRRVAKHMLTGLGLEVGEAANGEEALELCRKWMPDAIVLDWIMPDRGGLDCLQALRRLPGGATSKVIYCTSENNPSEFRRALLAGANGIIVKPYDRVTLRNVLAGAGVIESI
jgi:two-component system chemotaxis response regulator CheY